MKLLVHPETYTRLLDNITEFGVLQEMNALLDGVEIVQSELIEKEAPTGRVVWPDGSITLPDEHNGRFVQYEESDLGWLMALGGARWEMVGVYYLLDDQAFPFLPTKDFRLPIGDWR